LIFKNGYLFINLADKLWLIETGAPASFGVNGIIITNEQFVIGSSFMGLLAATFRPLSDMNVLGFLGLMFSEGSTIFLIASITRSRFAQPK
jgi:FAD/FMN-containing dehydrogenase